jgi:iron complex outermembrane receptor protein
VDRIEVIRGPGSVVYGDFAFMGLVNILTRKERHSRPPARRRRRPDRRRRPHLVGDADSPWQLTANLAGEHDDRAATTAPREAQADSPHGDRLAAQGAVRHRGAVDRRRPRRRHAAGAAGRQLSGGEETWAVDAHYERELAKAVTASIHLDALGTDASGGPLHFEDSLQRGEANVTSSAGRINPGSSASSTTRRTFVRATLTPAPPPGPAAAAAVIADKQRNVGSVVLQDRVDLSDAWSVTLGARYDDYSDVGSRVTPRVSLVYRQSDRHIWKAQYAEGLPRADVLRGLQRPGAPLNRNLDFEINRTTELNYVYRRPQATVA